MIHTLKNHKSRPFTTAISMSEVPAKTIAGCYTKFRHWLRNTETEELKIAPEKEAIWFYMKNHAMAIVEQSHDLEEPLSEVYVDIVVDYHKHMQVIALRAFFYLLMICIRESRHTHVGPGLEKLYMEYSKIKKFHNSIRGGGSGHAVARFLDSPPDDSLGQLSRFLEDVFFKAQYSGGYGGKNWGVVATVLRKFVYGEISAEMMVDTVWTLCHNNGPIFNKGLLYETYSGHELRKILDVQRAGMIPQLVDSQQSDSVNPEHMIYQQKIREHYSAFAGYVDWFKVEELGAVGNYPHEKSHQKSLYGDPTIDPAYVEKLKKGKEAVQKAKAEAIAKKASIEFEVMPGITVKKIKRSEM